jgi:hypothetical protein
MHVAFTRLLPRCIMAGGRGMSLENGEISRGVVVSWMVALTTCHGGVWQATLHPDVVVEPTLHKLTCHTMLTHALRSHPHTQHLIELLYVHFHYI